MVVKTTMRDTDYRAGHCLRFKMKHGNTLFSWMDQEENYALRACRRLR
jgi:hypothetical protein